MAKPNQKAKKQRAPNGTGARAEYNASWYARRQAERDAAGLCRKCGEAPRSPGKTQCAACVATVRAENARVMQKRIRSGMCVACNRTSARTGKVHCARCAREQGEYLKAKRSTPMGRIHGLLIRAKQRASSRGIPFDLEAKDLGLIPLVCPVLGIRLAFNNGRMKRNSPSLDRMKPQLGYVRGNVRVISQRANGLKSDATSEELEAVLSYVRSIERG